MRLIIMITYVLLKIALCNTLDFERSLSICLPTRVLVSIRLITCTLDPRLWSHKSLMLYALGDRKTLKDTGQGSVKLEIKLQNGKNKECTLHNALNVLLVSKSLRVTSTSKKGKVFTLIKNEI